MLGPPCRDTLVPRGTFDPVSASGPRAHSDEAPTEGAAGTRPDEPGAWPSSAMGGHCGSELDGVRLMADTAAPAAATPTDATALLRTKNYRVLLVLAAVIGVLVSLASWGYLELIHYIQQWVYKDLPSALSLAPVPSWWPLPVLAVSAFPIAFAIAKLPGGGGHKPAEGLKAGPPTQPIELTGRAAGLHRLHRPGHGARPRGPAHRTRGRSRHPRRKLSPEGTRPIRSWPCRCGGELRGHLLAVRVPDRRRGHHHRSRRPRGSHASRRPAAGIAGRRDRLAGVHRHGFGDGPQRERLRHRPARRCRSTTRRRSLRSGGRSCSPRSWPSPSTSSCGSGER